MNELSINNWEYDRSNPVAIEAYAKGLLGKTFQNVIDEDGEVDKSFFIPESKLYYTSPDIHHSDETKMPLEPE